MTELYVAGYWCPHCNELCSVDYDIDRSYEEDNVWFCFRCQIPNHVEKWEENPVFEKEDSVDVTNKGENR